MSLIVVNVNCEETGSTVALKLTSEEYERAKNDNEYVRDLVARHMANEVQEVEHMSNTPGENLEESSSSLFIWTNQAVQLFLSLYEEYSESFNDGSKRHKKIWEEIARRMLETNPKYILTGGQCQNKLNGLKRTYKKILDHNNKSGNDRASWPFFDRMQEIFGITAWAQPKALASEAGPFTELPDNSHVKKGDKPKKSNFKELADAREKIRIEKEEKKEARFNKLLEIRERHHKEKLELIKFLLSKNK